MKLVNSLKLTDERSNGKIEISTGKIERVNRLLTNFTIINEGLGSIKPEGNPFTREEIERLRYYSHQAERGEAFSIEEAQEFKQLSERAVSEYPNQSWVGELLKVALFMFALYALAKVLNPEST